MAEDHEVDLLHIKGPALDRSLQRSGPSIGRSARPSIDTDVLVRPSHVDRLTAALRANGWRRMYDFADGSAFEHAATWSRLDLANLDVHRYFPGIEAHPEHAFEVLWDERSIADIAGLACPVPSLDAQRLIVLIHAARGRSPRDRDDRDRAWYDLDDAERARIDELADRLSARVAVRAGTGRLDSVRGERTYPLWHHLTTGNGSLSSLWWARVRSAPSWRHSVRVGVRMVIPNRHRMETALGRPPTQRELLRAYRDQVSMAVRVVRDRVRPGRS